MPERPRLEVAGATLALLVCAAFVASFAFGLRAGGQPSSRSEDALVAPSVPAAGRVEVLNASGRNGLARAVTQRLRAAGFDVVYFGNAPASAGDSSVVIARSRDDAVARAAGKQLGITRISSVPDSMLLLDATVILGIDWQ